jgi:hypothetical protein
MPQKQKETNTRPLGKLANCRVIETGIGDIAECTQWDAVSCTHALPFGYCFICMHPRVGEIIENTKQALLAEKL